MQSSTPPPSAATSTAASVLRVISRHPRLTAASFVLIGAGLGFRRGAQQYHETELARQRAAPGFYVTVDRSGGGI
ncbi:hypothetical protein VTJ83DRAFT_4878 [Remersonia thermophila]|uniref:Uncharacterized protein n=1 Tax=Remersonia thermophila TaxID=72144 RepID=A0ABR4DB92_9PEZI